MRTGTCCPVIFFKHRFLVSAYPLTILALFRREEKFYDVEDVLGRDIASVFPTESKKAALQSDAAQAILLQGNKKFISETELAEIKSATGGRGRVEDGSIAADKPLAEILREQRETKEAKFQEQWRQMKTGKNRPLEEDEYVFLDSVAEAEAEQQRRVAAEEAAELDAFHRALKEQEEAKARDAEANAGTGGGNAAARAVDEREPSSIAPMAGKKSGLALGIGARVVVKPRITAVVRPKRGKELEPNDKAPLEASPKRQKIENDELKASPSSSGDDAGAGLAGLLGDYGSDSE